MNAELGEATICGFFVDIVEPKFEGAQPNKA
jgi:hypothetical protein